MKSLLIADVVLYVVACCLPVLEFRNSNGPNDVMLGLRALAVGWSGIFAGVFAWYANPCWLVALLLAFFRRPMPATLVTVVAIVIAANVFAIVGRELPADEGNVNKTAVVRVLPGCYVWLAAMALVPVAAYLQRPR